MGWYLLLLRGRSGRLREPAGVGQKQKLRLHRACTAVICTAIFLLLQVCITRYHPARASIMTVIAVCNQKGGSGKTTVAINLAGAFAEAGMAVLLLDMDPQGSALDWGSIQPALPPPFQVAEIDRSQLLRQARALRREYEVIVIDCPAKFTDSTSAAIRVADFVLVPVQPSPFDVWASDAVTGLVRTRQESTGGMPLAACVISRAINNTSLQRSIGSALEDYGLPVLRSGTTQRVAYATTAAQGKTVFEGRATVARREMESIRDEIKEMMHGAQSEA